MIELYEEIYNLKKLLRRGWVVRNAAPDRSESVSEHIFSCCVLALDIIEKEKLDLDQEKVLKILIYHEIGEIDLGDIIPMDNMSAAEKHDRELAGVSRVAEECGRPDIVDIWLEFEENKTKEAQFANKIDKLDAILQAEIYSNKTGNTALAREFYETLKHRIEGLEHYVDDTSK